MEKIVFKNLDGSVGIITPSPKWQGTLEELAKKDVPNGLEWRIVGADKLPCDRTFRDAWTDDLPTETVDVDYVKACDIKMAEIRAKRDEKLAELDIETMKGLDVQDEKQVLRDLPEKVVLPETVEALAEFVPDGLK